MIIMNNIKYDFNNLKIYAIRWDFNNNKPVLVNVMKYLDSEAFTEAVDKYNSVTNYEELYRWLSRELKNIFWGKSEFETKIKGLFSDNDVKIDIWSQLAPNIENIVDIVNKEFGLNYEKSLTKIKKDLSIIPYE